MLGVLSSGAKMLVILTSTLWAYDARVLNILGLGAKTLVVPGLDVEMLGILMKCPK